MRDRYSEFTERGAEVIAIAPDTVDAARSFFESKSLPFTCLPDPDREVFRMYDVKSAMISLGQRPGLFIVDRDGVVRYAHLWTWVMAAGRSTIWVWRLFRQRSAVRRYWYVAPVVWLFAYTWYRALVREIRRGALGKVTT